MQWVKRGHIFMSNGSFSWNRSHAQVPVADYLKEQEQIKVYFSTRDDQNRSRPGWVLLDAKDPTRVLQISCEPILELGTPGTFDDCGVMPSWVIHHDEKIYLYYIGWNVRNTIPYHNAVGLAISTDNGETFTRYSEGPLWDRDTKEPFYSGTSCVLVENGLWRNWYLSCTEWRKVKGCMEPRYHIKYAESVDGIHWKRDGKVAIDYQDEQEAGIVKASVLKDRGHYFMWYSYRQFEGYRTNPQTSYRIGYAVSTDGLEWKRLDDLVGINRSPLGWDSIMTAYPHVIRIDDRLLMFYNGNGFGASGFGYAECMIQDLRVDNHG